MAHYSSALPVRIVGTNNQRSLR